jgi:hypothetical protein
MLAGCGLGTVGPEVSSTSPEALGIGFGGDDRICSGFAWNFAWQPAQQKKYSSPLC